MTYIETFIRAESVHPTERRRVREGRYYIDYPVAYQDGDVFGHLRWAKGGIDEVKALSASFEQAGIKGDYAPGVSIDYRIMTADPSAGTVAIPTSVGMWKLLERRKNV